MFAKSRLSLRFSLSTLFLLVTALCVWLAFFGRHHTITPANANHMQQIKSLDRDAWRAVWSPDGRRVALLGWEKAVEIRDGATLEMRRSLLRGRKIIDFAFSPDGQHVAYCENGQGAAVLDLSTGRTLSLATSNDQPGVVFSPDGLTLATGGYGTDAHLWSVTDGKLLHALSTGSLEGGLTPAFSPDGRWLAVGNRNSTTTIFDTRTGRKVCSLPKRMSHQLKFHPTRDLLAIAYVDGSIGLWSVPDGRKVRMRQTSGDEVYSVDWSPDGRLLATSGKKGKITLWSVNGLMLVRELPSPHWVVDVEFSPDGQRIITAGGAINSGGKRKFQVWGLRPWHERIWKTPAASN